VFATTNVPARHLHPAAGPDEPPSDAVLAERVADGDLTAFRLLYDRYARAAYALAAHALGRGDAEEVVQDSFLRLWRKAAQYDPQRGSFNAWFMAIARHGVLDALRRRSASLVVADGVEAVLLAAADPSADLEEQGWCAARSARVLHALKELPEEQRRALVLAYFGGLSHSSIADSLGWPLGTVKKRVRLGLDKLRASLADEFGPDLLVADKKARSRDG
jgi:RNA polymerase sigma-70 factor, ECF subfamily